MELGHRKRQNLASVRRVRNEPRSSHEVDRDEEVSLPQHLASVYFGEEYPRFRVPGEVLWRGREVPSAEGPQAAVG